MTRPAADGAPVGREELLALLAEFVDDEPCWFDHNGSCQAHGDFNITPERPCFMARARAAIASATPPTARTVNPPVSDPEGDSPVSGVSADRTAGSLTADDLGRTVTVTPASMTYSGLLHAVHHTHRWAWLTIRRGNVMDQARCTADTPVHVHDEEAGR